ncbi:hypothetical protein EVAR_64442_1 [Eumeta japonica]|uniref:Uncharacterized protein n=1 Tax=Eumeta variegata TaxID=151549 RepID=A0A4C1YTA9_EUMVA|nr:hypothetical protein EVAR_64442_1 [Eumeta japonica]
MTLLKPIVTTHPMFAVVIFDIGTRKGLIQAVTAGRAHAPTLRGHLILNFITKWTATVDAHAEGESDYWCDSAGTELGTSRRFSLARPRFTRRTHEAAYCILLVQVTRLALLTILLCALWPLGSAAPAALCTGADEDPRAARFCQALNTFLELYAEAAGEQIESLNRSMVKLVANGTLALMIRLLCQEFIHEIFYRRAFTSDVLFCPGSSGSRLPPTPGHRHEAAGRGAQLPALRPPPLTGTPPRPAPSPPLAYTLTAMFDCGERVGLQPVVFGFDLGDKRVEKELLT